MENIEGTKKRNMISNNRITPKTIMKYDYQLKNQSPTIKT